MKTCLIFVLCTLVATSSPGQQVYGTVIDGATNAPLAYVHIGVAGKKLGVISRDDGSFRLDLTNADLEDRIVFSIISFESRSFAVGAIRERKLDVRMVPIVYEFRDATFANNRRERQAIKLGRYTPTEMTDGWSGKEEFGSGGEVGVKISPAGKKYHVDDVRFHMRYNTVDSILFRVNLYKVENGMPGKSILQREIYVKAYTYVNWITAGLKSENIVMDQELIVTYEVVRVWFSKLGENRMAFSYGKGYEGGVNYYRHSSQAAWTTDSKRGPAAMYLTLEEY